MSLTIVSIAYPFVPIGPIRSVARAGTGPHRPGTVRHGHRSIVIGAEGSKIAGTLAATPGLGPDETADPATWEWRMRSTRDAEACTRHVDVDVVHMHGVDFQTYRPTTVHRFLRRCIYLRSTIRRTFAAPHGR